MELLRLNSFLVLFFFAIAPAIANDEWAFPDSLQTEIILSSQSILNEFSDRVNQKVEEKGLIEDSQMKALFQDATQKILENFEQKGKRPGLSTRLWQGIRNLNWENLVELTKKTGRKLGKFGKRHGVAAASGIVLGTALDFIVPTILVEVNLPALIPFSAFTPYQAIIYGTTKKVEQKISDIQLAEVYGGMKELKRLRAAHENVRKEFSLHTADDLILPLLTKNGGKLVVLSETNLEKRALGLLGVKDHRVTLSSLTAFYKEHWAGSKLVEALGNIPNMTKRTKAALLVSHLYDQGGDKRVQEFEKHFYKGVFSYQVNANGKNRTVLEWAKGFSTIKNQEALKEHVKKMPKAGSVKSMANLWLQVLVPQLTNEMEDLSYRQSRNLKKKLLPLLAQASKGNPQLSEGDWHSRFSSYIDEVFAPKQKSCRSTLFSLGRR